MDTLQIVLVVAVIVSMAVIPAITGRAMKRAVTLVGRSASTKKIFESMGLHNVKLEDFNKLTPEGVANFIAIRKADKEPTVGDPETSKILNQLNSIRQASLGMQSFNPSGLLQSMQNLAGTSPSSAPPSSSSATRKLVGVDTLEVMEAFKRKKGDEKRVNLNLKKKK